MPNKENVEEEIKLKDKGKEGGEIMMWIILLSSDFPTNIAMEK